MERSKMFLILLIFVSSLPPPSSCTSTAFQGLRVELTHVDSNSNLTKYELIQRATQRSNHRMTRLISKTKLTTSKKATAGAASIDNVETPVHAGNGEFLMDLAIGTPSVAFSAILDTGSDLIWTQCKPCTQCFTQPTPIFNPSSSSTFSKISCSAALCQALPTSTCSSKDCDYAYSYGDSSSTQGVLASETFTFGSKKTVPVPDIGFGCGDDNQGSGFSQASGLVGLGRGPLSLISQLGVGKFSYCLTSLDDSKTSPLLFGSLAELDGSKENGTQSTPLTKNPNQPSFYYLNLKGITVGGAPLSIPSSTFALQDDGTGGLIIDSGTSITYLEEAGYKILKKAFLSRVKLPVADGSDVGLDLCFSLPSGSSSVEVPKLMFNFDGADLELPAENYMIIDSSTDLLCLTVMPSTGLSIFGNFQQQNLQILYDLDKNMLSLVPAQCNQL